MPRILRLVIALGFLTASLPASAQDAANPQSFFVLVYSQGPSWKPGTPMAKQRLGKHLAYMLSLRDTHKLFLAGPLKDANGGLILLRAKSIDDAKAIMAHDPAIMTGVFVGNAHAWEAPIDSGKTAKDFLAQPE
ncbi:MAG: hypothetical protein JSR55_13045 [Proteobacteria bacterium]|nr:hypothetical protein [Pseudomonadota bacterium]